MDIQDHYISIAALSSGDYREKGSKFLAYASPVTTETEMAEFLTLIKKDHPKARHYCYAYRLGIDKYNFRTNDDGEPSGTAGRPILGAIDSLKLSDTGIIVVRYFGGTKLGVSGLINAYKSASLVALQNAELKDIYITKTCTLRFDYGHMGIIMNTIKQLNLEISKMELAIDPYLEVTIRESSFDHNIKAIKASLLNRKVEDIDEETSIPYCTFES